MITANSRVARETCDNPFNSQLSMIIAPIVISCRLQRLPSCSADHVLLHRCVSPWVRYMLHSNYEQQSECNQHSKTRWGPGSCCYRSWKQRSINYACSRHCAHYDSGKLSVTFCDPVHIHREYCCARKAPLTYYSRKGHSCIWNKNIQKFSFSLKCLWSGAITIIAAQYQCRYIYTLITSSPWLDQHRWSETFICAASTLNYVHVYTLWVMPRSQFHLLLSDRYMGHLP